VGAIYQLTFFVSLAILAILITIFVFAVSLLGRALEAATKEQEKTTKEQKDAAEEEIAAIQKQISNLGKKGRIDKEKLEELEAKLKQLRKQDERFEKKLSRIGKAPQLLTVRGGVVPPATSLLGALLLTAGAWYLSTIQIFICIPLLIWILGLAAIAYSVSRIYLSLKMIEGVAITSEETALRRTIEAFKIAQKELEEERKPKLGLKWRGTNPPFHIKADSPLELKFGVFCERGDFADDVSVVFFAPPGFTFPTMPTLIQESSHPIVPEFVTTSIRYTPPVTRGTSLTNDVSVKAPPEVGEFEAYYQISCRGFCSEFEKFKIVVEEPELEPEDIQF